MNSLPDFEALTPDFILTAVEKSYGLRLGGVISPFNSYVNRVYGVDDEEGGRFVAKFYRPGRWTAAAIRDEHRFVLQSAAGELPVIPPLPGTDGETLQSAGGFLFTLFPLKGGRTFDPVSGEDWFRIGSLVGRLHRIGADEEAAERIGLLPAGVTARQIETLTGSGLIPPQENREFAAVAEEILREVIPLFEGVPAIRIHGDCHRGNILDRPGEGLMLIDFDDMANGPAVQDLWLLIPGTVEESYAAVEELIEGYNQFRPFDRSTLRLVEPLRFMRMIHYLHWCSLQTADPLFTRNFPDWGSAGFWIKEVEDLRDQQKRITETGI
jgi:Ser/Thr protein kinase RdoA (MazF antagonist)